MNDLVKKDNIVIENMIYEVRGKQVMLASDVAFLYNSEAKVINQVVKRNLNRFPNEFCFQLTREEYINILRSQNVTLELKQGQYSKYNPYVFTEQGVMMLSGLLKSEEAARVNVAIVKAFTVMKKYISNNLLEQKYINELVLKNSKRIDLLETTFSKFKENSEEIFFDGQIFDAYSKIIEILKLSKKEIILIDAYADETTLKIFSKINVDIILLTKEKGLLKDIDIEKYNKQYHNLKIKYINNFHDRYIIIDRKMIYHCGSSLNHIGKKTTSINKIEDQKVIELLIGEIEKLI